MSARLVAVCAVVVAVIGGGAVWWVMRGEDHPPPGLTIRFGDTEARLGCVYDAAAGTVEARVSVDGFAPRSDYVRVTVTAYADENTSRPVGAAIRSVLVRGAVHDRVTLTVPVDAAPHVDEDGVAACEVEPLSVDY